MNPAGRRALCAGSRGSPRKRYALQAVKHPVSIWSSSRPRREPEPEPEPEPQPEPQPEPPKPKPSTKKKRKPIGHDFREGDMFFLDGWTVKVIGVTACFVSVIETSIMGNDTKKRYRVHQDVEHFFFATPGKCVKQKEAVVANPQHDLLGVPVGASSSQIRKAWLAMSVKHHPDKGGSAELMMDINSAYRELYDKAKARESFPNVW